MGKGESFTFPGLSFAATIIMILAGLFVQSFIVVVNVLNWMNRGSLKPADQIITSLGITKILYHAVSFSEVFANLYYRELYHEYFIINIFTAQTLALSTIWLSTSLSIFFCFKISNFHNVFFLRLKAIISQTVSYLIIASVLFAFGISLTCFFLTFNVSCRNSTSDFHLEFTKTMQTLSSCDVLWNIFPAHMYFLSSVLLIISLSFHMWRMKHCGNAISSMDTYHRIMKFTAISFLVCALQITLNLNKKYGFRFFGVLGMILIWNMFPILHSMSLIYIKTRLRNQFFKLVHCGSSFFNRNV
uniref:Taste receptor type 2 n=1 Tax=Pyxicephalus adspersus TaxID=30357 RepID=A0AAV3AEV5_PYXAD|nr:TPA: hypothetical protein GDO54_009878 [Pyxicephalus adspersus]